MVLPRLTFMVVSTMHYTLGVPKKFPLWRVLVQYKVFLAILISICSNKNLNCTAYLNPFMDALDNDQINKASNSVHWFRTPWWISSLPISWPYTHSMWSDLLFVSAITWISLNNFPVFCSKLVLFLASYGCICDSSYPSREVKVYSNFFFFF